MATHYTALRHGKGRCTAFFLATAMVAVAMAVAFLSPQSTAAARFEGTVTLRDLAPAGTLSNPSSNTGLIATAPVLDDSLIAVDIGLRMIHPGTSSPTIDQILVFGLQVSWPKDSLLFTTSTLLHAGADVSTAGTWTSNNVTVTSDLSSAELSRNFLTVHMVGAQGSNPRNFPNILCGDFCQWPSLMRLYFHVGALPDNLSELSVDISNQVTGIVDHRGSSTLIHSTGTFTLSVRPVAMLQLGGLPTPVEVLDDVMLTATPYSSDGSLLYGDYLFSPATSLTLTSLDGSALSSTYMLGTSLTSLVLRVQQAREGSKALLTLEDRGVVTTAELVMNVRASALLLSLQSFSVSTVGHSYSTQLGGVDALGNIDLDYAPTVLSSMPEVAGLSYADGVLSVQIQPSPSTPLMLTVLDDTGSGTLSGSVLLPDTASLVATASPTVVSGQDFEVEVLGRNAAGAEASIFALSSSATVEALVTPEAVVTIVSIASSTMILSVSGVADNTELLLTLGDQGLTTTFTVRVDVEGTELSVQPSRDGAQFELQVSAVDADGAVDEDYQLGTAAMAASSMALVTEISRTGNSLRISLSAISSVTVMVVVSDGQLSGSVLLMTADLLLSSLSVAISSPTVVSGQDFELEVLGRSAIGEAVSTFALSSSVTVEALLAPEAVVTIVSIASSSVILSVSGVADNTELLLTLEDQGFTTTFTVLVDVEGTELSVQSSRDGIQFELQVSAVDADGAVDEDYQLGTAAMAASSMALVTEISRTGNSLRISLSAITSSAAVTVVVSDGELSGAVLIILNLSVTSLRVEAAPVVVPGASYTLTLFGVDAQGNDLSNYQLPLDAALDVLSALTVIESQHVPGTTSFELMFTEVLGDNNFVSVQVSAGGLTTLWEPKVEVQATELAVLVLTEEVSPMAAAASFLVHGIDSFGNIDSDYALPSPSATSLTVVLADGNPSNQLGAMLVDVNSVPGFSSVEWLLTKATDNSEILLQLTDGNISGESTLRVTVVAASLVLQVPILVPVGHDATLSVQAFDLLGNQDLDYVLPPSLGLSVADHADPLLVLSPGSQFTFARAGDLSLSLRLLSGVVDDQELLFSLDDGTLPAAEATATVTTGAMSLQIELVEREVPGVVVSGTTFTVTITPLDSRGIVDPLYTPSASLGVEADDLGDAATLELRGVSISTSTITAPTITASLRIYGAPDNHPFSLVLSDVLDARTVSGSLNLQLWIVATELHFSVPPVLFYEPDGSSSLSITVRGINRLNEVDVDVDLSAQAEVLSSPISTTATLSFSVETSSTITLFLSDVTGSGSIAISVRDQGLATTRTLNLREKASGLVVTLSTSTITAGDIFEISVAGYDHTGALDPAFALSNSWRLDVQAREGVVRVSSTQVSDTVLELRIEEVVDNNLLTFSVSDRGAVGETTAAVVVVVTEFVVRSAPSVVVPGTTYTVTVFGADALGNEDLDYSLSPTARLSTQTLFFSDLAAVERIDNGFEFSVSQFPLDGGFMRLRLADDSLIVEIQVLVDVIADRLSLQIDPLLDDALSTSLPALLIPAVDGNLLLINATDAFGNFDRETVFTSTPTVSIDTVISGGAVPVFTELSAAELGFNATDLLLEFTGVEDGAELIVSVEIESLSGSIPILADVRADHLSLLPAEGQNIVVLNSTFTLSILAGDALGNVDSDYMLSSTFNLAVDAAGVALSYARVNGREFGMQLTSELLGEGQEVLVTLSDQGFVATTTVAVTFSATRITLVASTATSVVAGETFTLQVLGYNALGELLPDFKLFQTPALIVSSGAGRIVRLKDDGANGQLSVILTRGVIDHSTLELTVQLTDQPMSPLRASVEVETEVQVSELQLSIASPSSCMPMAVCSEDSSILSISGADSNGNVDSDFVVSAGAVLSVAGEVTIDRLLADRYEISLSAGYAEGSYIRFTATDQSFDGALLALVDVQTSQLWMAVVPDVPLAEPSLVSGSSFTISVFGVDRYAQIDGDFDLAELGVALSASGAVSGALQLSAEQRRNGNDLSYTLLDDVFPGEQITLRLTVSDGSFDPVEIQVEARAMSGALRIVPPLSALVSLAEPVHLQVQWLDSAHRLNTQASGPVDAVQLRLSPELALLSTSQLTVPVGGLSTLTLVLAEQEVLDHSNVELILSHPSLSSSSLSLEIVIQATRLVLVVPTTPVASFSTFTLSVSAQDGVGNVDVDYPLSSVILGAETAGALLEPVALLEGGKERLVRLSGVADGAVVTLSANSADASLESAFAELTVNVVASALALSALPPFVAAGQGMLISLEPQDAAGFVDGQFPLSAAPVVSVSAGQFLAQPAEAGRVLLLISTSDAPPVGSTVTITVSDSGISGQLELPVVPASSTATLSIATATVVVGESIDLRVQLLGAQGNLLVEPRLSTPTVVVLSGAERYTVSLVRGMDGVSTVTLMVQEAQDRSLAQLFLLDPLSGLFAVATLPLDVQADRLHIAERASVPLDRPFILTVSALDAMGNRDIDYRHSSGALSVSSGTLVVAGFSEVEFELILMGDHLVDGQQLLFSATDSSLAVTVTTLSVSVDVQATGLILSAQSPVSPGSSFTLSAVGSDDRGRIDTDFAFSPAVELSVSGVAQDSVFFRRSTSSALSVELLFGFRDASTYTLQVVDQGLSSSIALTVDVVADRLAVTLDSTSMQTVALHTSLGLSLRYIDRYGNEDTDLNRIDSAFSNDDPSGVSVLNDGRALEATDYSITVPGVALEVTPRYAVDRGVAVLEVRDTVVFDGVAGVLVGSTTLSAEVVGTAINLAVPPSDPPSDPPQVPSVQAFPLDIQVVDSYGNVDLDAELMTASFSVLSVSSGDPTALFSSSTLKVATRQLLLRLGGLPEGTDITLSVTGALEGPGLPLTEGSLGEITVRLDVITTHLSISPVARSVTPGTSETFVVGGLDIYDQVDGDFMLSSSAVASVTSPATASIERSATANAFDVRVLRASGGSNFRLTVDDGGGRIGHSTLTAVLDIDRLVFLGPSTVQTGVYTPLSIGAFDALGNFEAEVALSAIAELSAANSAVQLDSRVSDGVIELLLEGGVTEGEPVELMLSDAPHSTVVSVVPRVEHTQLGIELPDQVVADGAFAVRLLGLDDYGNIDADFVMSDTATLSVAAPGSLSALQLTPAAAGISAEDANRIATTISGLSAGQTAVFTASDAGRSATAQIVLIDASQVIPTQWQLRDVTEFVVVSLRRNDTTFPVNMVPVDDFGNIASSYPMPAVSSISLSVTRGDASDIQPRIEVTGVVGRTLFARVRRAQDNSTLTLHVVDTEGELSTGTTTVVARVYTEVMALDVPEFVRLTEVFTVPLVGVDLRPVNGDFSTVNVDEDFRANLPLAVEMSGDYEVVVETSRSLSLRIINLNAQDGTQLPLKVTENAGLGFSASATIYVSVDGVALLLDVEEQVVADTTFTVMVTAVDALGLRDLDFDLLQRTALTQLSLNGDAGRLRWEATGASSIAVRLLTITEGETLLLSVVSGDLSGMLSLYATVGSSQSLELTPPVAPIVLGSSFVLTVDSVDGAGNRDPFYSLASASTLQVYTQPESVVNFALDGQRQIRLQLGSVTSRLDNPPSTLNLTVVVDDLEQTVVLDVRVVADRLQLQLPDELIVAGTTFRLTVIARDRLGNRQSDYDVRSAGLSVDLVPAPASLVWAYENPDTVRVQLQRIITTTTTYTIGVRSGVGAQQLYGEARISTTSVVVDRLQISGAPEVVVVGSTFTLTVLAQDRFGNNSTDDDLSMDLPVVTSSPEAALSVRVISANTVELAVLEPVPSALLIRIRRGELIGELQLPRPLVQPTRLVFTSTSVEVVVGSSVSLTVIAVDDAGNRDVFYDLRDQDVRLDLPQSAQYRWTIVDFQTVELYLSNAPSPTLPLLLHSSGTNTSLSGELQLQLRVEPVRLSLQLERMRVSAGSSFTIVVNAIDALGNISFTYDLRDAPLSLYSTPELRWNARAVSAQLIDVQAWSGDESTVSLTVSSGSLLGAADIFVLAPSFLVLVPSSAAPLVVGQSTVTLDVSARFANGDIDTTFRLHLPSLEVTASPDGTELQVVETSTSTLTLMLLKAADNSSVTITVATLGAQASQEFGAEVVASQLELDVASSLQPFDEPFVLNYRGVDGYSNIDLDYQVPLPLQFGSTYGVVTTYTVTASSASISIGGEPVARQLLSLSVAATDGLTGSIDLMLFTTGLPDHLDLGIVSAPVVVGSTFTLTVQVVDAINTPIPDYPLELSSVGLALDTSSVGSTVATQVGSSSNTVVLRISGTALDNSTASLTLISGEFLGTVELTLAVEASRLVVTTTAANIVVNEVFALSISGVDSFGNIDLDYTAPLPLQLLTTEGVLTQHAVTGSQVSISIGEVSTRQLSVSVEAADGLIGSIDLMLDSTATPADHLELGVVSTSIVVGSTFALTVQAVDAVNAPIPAYPLELSSVGLTLDASGGSSALATQVGGSGNTVVLRISGAVSDNSAVRLTLSSDGLLGTIDLTLAVEASRLVVTTTATNIVVDGVFVLAISGADSFGNIDLDYTAPLPLQLLPSAGVLTQHVATGGQVSISIGGVSSSAQLSVSVEAADGFIGSIDLILGNRATHLELGVVSTAIVVGSIFTLTVQAVDATNAPFPAYPLELSNVSLTLDISSGSGALATQVGSSGNTVELRISGTVSDNSTARLTLSSDGLLGTIELTLAVEAAQLRVVGATEVLGNTLFTLVVSGMDADGNVDDEFELSAAVAVTVSEGVGRATSVLLLSASELQLQLVDLVVAQTSALQLSVSDQGISGFFSVAATSFINLDLNDDGVIDVLDATLFFRGFRLTADQLRRIASGEISNVLAAGYTNLLPAEAEIAGKVQDMLAIEPPIFNFDLDPSNEVGVVDATLLFRAARLTKTGRENIINGISSDIVVAGYTNLLSAEAEIVRQIQVLLGE